MSRLSQKSRLSPSVTRGHGIDLGKDSGVDLGQKSQPSMTSGGIGLTQEVTNIGGTTVSAGIEVDLTPVDFGVNFNPSEGTLAVGGGAEIPGGLLGVSGGIEVDLATGEVIGGNVGAEVGGLGINLSNSKKGGLGVEFTLQIPGTPIELSIGFGFPPGVTQPETPDPYTTPPFSPGVENLIQPLTPILPPYPDPLSPPPFEPAPPKPPRPPIGGKNEICKMVVTLNSGSHQRYWSSLGHRQAGQGRTNKGMTNNLEYDDNGRLTGYVASHIYTYYWERAEGASPVNGKTESTPPLRPPPTPYFPWNGGGYPHNPIDIPFIRRPLAGYEVWEYWGLQYSIYEHLEEISYIGTAKSGRDTSLLSWYFFYSLSPSYTIYSIEAHWCGKKPEKSPPFPNPPPRRQNKMDACCRETLAFLRLMYTKLGLAKFPGQLPNTIIQEVPKEGEEPAEPPQVPIPDLVSLLNWTFERDDERWGQWMVQIDVKDSDITKEGNQGKQVKFPNLAESIAEIEGQILSLSANVDGLVAVTAKNLVESGLGRQEAIKSYLAAKTIIKYMAFKTEEIDVEIPSTYTPEAQTIAEFIKESMIHFKGIDYTEKETLRDIYLDLLQAAAIIRAVHWQQIDTKQDTKGQILKRLQEIAGLANLVKNPTPAGETQPKRTEDFEDFLDTVEDGFRNVAGVTDSENAYGRTPDRRPRIRQIGENISQAGGKS